MASILMATFVAITVMLVILYLSPAYGRGPEPPKRPPRTVHEGRDHDLRAAGEPIESLEWLNCLMLSPSLVGTCQVSSMLCARVQLHSDGNGAYRVIADKVCTPKDFLSRFSEHFTKHKSDLVFQEHVGGEIVIVRYAYLSTQEVCVASAESDLRIVERIILHTNTQPRLLPADA